MPSRRILLYGDINLNLVDGSAVWLASLAEVLGAQAGLEVDLLLKSPLEHPDVLEEARVRTIPPPEAIGRAAGPGPWVRLLGWGLVTPANLVRVLRGLEREQRYDLILVRGLEANWALATHEAARGRLAVYLTDIPQRFLRPDSPEYTRLAAVVSAARLVLCQTDEFRNFLEAFFPEARGRCALLPPMVPEDFYAVRARPEADTHHPTLLYAGKFAPDWGTNALFELLDRLQLRVPGARLRAFGDKIHSDPRNAHFRRLTQKQLETGEGIDWVPRAGRAELARACGEATIGYALLIAALDDSLEISTKILEYGAASLPVLLNRNRRHAELLGEDYPLFANSAEEGVQAVLRTLEEPARLAEAAARCHQASLPHRFEAVGRSLAESIARKLPAVVAAKDPPPTLVVASHDLKFFDPIREHVLEAGGYTTRFDRWSSLRDHDPAASEALLAEAEIVFCEWCAGNAVWYSRHMRPDQRLYVRFHRVEIDMEFPPQLAIDAVTKVVFVSEHLRRAAMEKFGWPEGKTWVIPNSVDAVEYDRRKSSWSRYNLGLAGFLPALKRPDLALDVLERLLARDARYKLYLRGKLPWELDWLWKREEHRPFYLALLERIAANPALRDAVVFDEFDTDMPRWYQKIGYILSLSDIESFHLAVAEGMASGALPLILEREGARDIFGAQWVIPTVDAIAERVMALNADSERATLVGECRSFAREHYDIARLSGVWSDLLRNAPAAA